MKKLADDLKILMNHFINKFLKEAFQDGLSATGVTYEITKEALIFKCVILGKHFRDMQNNIQGALGDFLDNKEKMTGNVCAEIAVGLSADALTSNDEDVWNESVLSHIDQGCVPPTLIDRARHLCRTQSLH